MPESSRLIEIESQLSHLARHIEALDEVVIAQGRELQQLNRVIERLGGRLARIEARIETGRDGPGDEPEESPWKDPEM